MAKSPNPFEQAGRFACILFDKTFKSTLCRLEHEMRTELDIIAERQFAVEQAEARGEARGEAKQKAGIAKAMLAKNLGA